ncbi:hypothetical protein [uncultured Winogradskyella sp.]|uniref:hypothetical protein n=1 Tax=uncultured Winogradskyella sp. TaxID=395353 RepID=UPI0026211682|nr:hypothetical protein [uncultured Winogradskyella sp.]
MQKFTLLLTLFLVLNSCATLLNGKTTRVKIHARKGTVVTYKDSTYKVKDQFVKIFPKRSKDSLKLTISNDSLSQDFNIPKRLSGTLALNLFVPYSWAGVVIDFTNQKRFTYKKNLRFSIDSTNSKFYRHFTLPVLLKKNDFFIYTSPLKAIDLFTQPMLTIGGEYFFTDRVSFSAEYGTVYTDRLGGRPNLELYKNKGRSIRYEIKLYNTLIKPKNPRFNKYIGFEARYIRYLFNDNISYTATDEEISFFVRETVGVTKTVDIYNLKLGINYPIDKRLFIDLYSGLGIRIRRIENLNNTFNAETDTLIVDQDCFLCFRKNEAQDSGTFFNFTLGFKFGYKF